MGLAVHGLHPQGGGTGRGGEPGVGHPAGGAGGCASRPRRRGWMSPLSPARSPLCQAAPPVPAPWGTLVVLVNLVRAGGAGVTSLPALEGGLRRLAGCRAPSAGSGEGCRPAGSDVPGLGDAALGTLGCPWGPSWGQRPRRWVPGAVGQPGFSRGTWVAGSSVYGDSPRCVRGGKRHPALGGSWGVCGQAGGCPRCPGPAQSRAAPSSPPLLGCTLCCLCKLSLPPAAGLGRRAPRAPQGRCSQCSQSGGRPGVLLSLAGAALFPAVPPALRAGRAAVLVAVSAPSCQGAPFLLGSPCSVAGGHGGGC